MDDYETTAKYNIAETCAASISINELAALSENKEATAGGERQADKRKQPTAKRVPAIKTPSRRSGIAVADGEAGLHWRRKCRVPRSDVLAPVRHKVVHLLLLIRGNDGIVFFQ